MANKKGQLDLRRPQEALQWALVVPHDGPRRARAIQDAGVASSPGAETWNSYGRCKAWAPAGACKAISQVLPRSVAWKFLSHNCKQARALATFSSAYRSCPKFTNCCRNSTKNAAGLGGFIRGFLRLPQDSLFAWARAQCFAVLLAPERIPDPAKLNSEPPFRA